MGHCDECGGRIDRPGLCRCDRPCHPRPTLAQRIAREIERDLNEREDMDWDGVDEEVRYEIRDRWAELIDTELAK